MPQRDGSRRFAEQGDGPGPYGSGGYGHGPRRPVNPPIFNNVPPGVLILAIPMVLAFVAGAFSEEFQIWWTATNAVVAVDLGEPMPRQPLGNVLPYLTHVFLHFGLLHIAFNTTALVALGRLVGSAFGEGVMGTAGFLIFFFTCSVAGALADFVTHSGELRLLGGASTGVSGLLAAAGWVRGGWRGMASLALPWIAVNIVIGLAGLAIALPIGWIAHIGGVVAGIVLFPPMLMLMRERRR